MNTGASFSDLSSDFWWLLVWMVVSFIIATKAFRWDVSK